MDVKTLQDAAYQHMLAGTYRHPRFPDTRFALAVLIDRIDRLKSAIWADTDPDHAAKIARRLLQTAGLCFRTMMDLDLPVILPPAAQEPHDGNTKDHPRT